MVVAARRSAVSTYRALPKASSRICELLHLAYRYSCAVLCALVGLSVVVGQVVEALQQLDSLRCWLRAGATEVESSEEAAPPEDEPEPVATEDGEEPPPPGPQLQGAAMQLWMAQLLRLEGWVAIELALSVLRGLSYSSQDNPQLRSILRMLRHAVEMLETAEPG